MKHYIKLVFFVFSWCLLSSCGGENTTVDLSGKWQVVLEDEAFTGKTFDIDLPGTTDLAGIGYADTLGDYLTKPQVLRLTRKNEYVGKARYTREFKVPANLADMPLELTLERVLWRSRITIDGKPIEDNQISLVTPHRHLLPPLPVGNHTIEVEVDNSKLLDISVDELCHSYTDATQVKWNGVLGEMTLRAINEAKIDRIEVYPNVNDMTAEALVYLYRANSSEQTNVTVECNNCKATATIPAGKDCAKVTLDMKDATLWSEFTPVTYTVTATSQRGDARDEAQTQFGMRQIANQDGKLAINGNPVFLRGTLECCIFPLTGNPPTDEASWEQEFLAAKEWGLNHLRFHSWCPPDAAFRVADKMGFYLQVELPVWSLKVGADPAVCQFMESEMENIIRNYGNHPSLCMISNGNELQYDFEFLNGLTRKAKARDPRHLYITTSFTFEKGHGGHNEPEDEYYVTQWTDSGWVRGQGVFDSEVPSFNKNYNSSMGCLSVPLVSHEIGQYAVYPDMKEICKYTGTLDPHNFKAVRADLERKGLIDRAEDYLQASGRLAAILYKEECERAMKTQGLSGYQLLGLQDFSGQGTALVGLVNAFWESKGLVEPAWFRQFCAPVVPLANFEKAVWSNSETLALDLQIANYTTSAINGGKLLWTLKHQDGTVYRDGQCDITSIPNGDVSHVADVHVALDGVTKAEQMTLTLAIADTDYNNEWNVWVYPVQTETSYDDIFVTSDVKAAVSALDEGKKVLLSPQLGSLKGLEGKFLPVFWSPVHFPKQAGTMGLLCDPEHPAFSLFPTEGFGNWQWWRLEKRSTVLNIDSLQTLTPIVEAVDNFVNNRRLATVVEARCGKGMLILSAMDLLSDGADSPEIAQFRQSLIHYMSMSEFLPKGEISSEQLYTLFNKDIKVTKTEATSIY